MVYSHSSLLFAPDASCNTFSSFRSIPLDYSCSTERWFISYACTSLMIDLLSSFIQHSLILVIKINDSRHTPAQRRPSATLLKLHILFLLLHTSLFKWCVSSFSWCVNSTNCDTSFKGCDTAFELGCTSFKGWCTSFNSWYEFL